MCFRIRGYHPLWLAFQTLPLTLDFVTPCRTCRSDLWLPRPRLRNACMLTRKRFGLFRVRSPLLPESLLFSFPVGTEMVQNVARQFGPYLLWALET